MTDGVWLTKPRPAADNTNRPAVFTVWVRLLLFFLYIFYISQLDLIRLKYNYIDLSSLQSSAFSLGQMGCESQQSISVSLSPDFKHWNALHFISKTRE